MLQTLKSYVQASFNAGDSINVMFSGYYTDQISNSWMSADSLSLLQTLNTIDTSDLKNYSNLPALLLDGINFIQSKGNNGNIVLISSSANFSNTNDANDLLNNATVAMGQQKIPVHTLCLDDKSYLNYHGNSYYRGNEYFLSNLSMLTGGEYHTIVSYNYVNDWWWYYYEPEYSSFEEMLEKTIPRLSGHFSAPNVYTSLSSGLTFADFNLTSENGFTYFGSPYRRVGKYSGEFPMTVIVAAQTPDGQLYNAQFNIDSTEVLPADSVSETIWAARNLREMLSYEQTNSVVYQVVLASMAERVLTKYTAFLALEPGMLPPDTVVIPNLTTDGLILNVGDEDSLKKDFNIHCYPNPVSAVMYFEFTLPEYSEMRIDVFNLQMQKVAVVAEKAYAPGMHREEFNADRLTPGIYFYRVSDSGKTVYAGKFMVAKP